MGKSEGLILQMCSWRTFGGRLTDKFFQIRFGETDKFLIDTFGDKTPYKTFLRAYCYKTIQNYQDDKINAKIREMVLEGRTEKRMGTYRVLDNTAPIKYSF